MSSLIGQDLSGLIEYDLLGSQKIIKFEDGDFAYKVHTDLKLTQFRKNDYNIDLAA